MAEVPVLTPKGERQSKKSPDAGERVSIWAMHGVGEDFSRCGQTWPRSPEVYRFRKSVTEQKVTGKDEGTSRRSFPGEGSVGMQILPIC